MLICPKCETNFHYNDTTEIYEAANKFYEHGLTVHRPADLPVTEYFSVGKSEAAAAWWTNARAIDDVKPVLSWNSNDWDNRYIAADKRESFEKAFAREQEAAAAAATRVELLFEKKNLFDNGADLDFAAWQNATYREAERARKAVAYNPDKDTLEAAAQELAAAYRLGESENKSNRNRGHEFNLYARHRLERLAAGTGQDFAKVLELAELLSYQWQYVASTKTFKRVVR